MTTSRGTGPAWTAVYTEPKAELWAIQGITAIGMPAWTPRERVIARQRGRAGDITRPYFPRYVFVDLASHPEHMENWLVLQRVDGVVHVLANNARPMLVPTAAIKALQHAEAVGAFDLTQREPIGLKIGDHVRIAGGPFAGMQAQIDAFFIKLRSTTQRKRARVLVDFIGRFLTVDLPIEQLEKL